MRVYPMSRRFSGPAAGPRLRSVRPARPTPPQRTPRCTTQCGCVRPGGHENMPFDFPIHPTSALDPELVGEVLDVIRKLAHEDGLTMIISTHPLRFAAEVADLASF